MSTDTSRPAGVVWCMDWAGDLPADVEEPRDGQMQWFIMPPRWDEYDADVAMLLESPGAWVADCDAAPLAGPFGSRWDAYHALLTMRVAEVA